MLQPSMFPLATPTKPEELAPTKVLPDDKKFLTTVFTLVSAMVPAAPPDVAPAVVAPSALEKLQPLTSELVIERVSLAVEFF